MLRILPRQGAHYGPSINTFQTTVINSLGVALWAGFASLRYLNELPIGLSGPYDCYCRRTQEAWRS